MIMDNEKKKLSRNRKRRFEWRIETADNMNLLLNKIKTEKKTKNKNFVRIKPLEIELIKIKYANNPNKLQSEPKELNRIQVVDKRFYEIKQEKLRDYTSEFERVGKLKIGDQIRQTYIRFRNVTDFETYINSFYG